MINLKQELRLNFFTLVNNYSSRYYEGMVHKVFEIPHHSLRVDLRKKKKEYQANIFVTSRKMLIISYSSKRVRSGEKT